MCHHHLCSMQVVVVLVLLASGCGGPEPGASFHGDQGGEKVVSASGNAGNPLRTRKDLAWYRLTGAKKNPRKFGRESYSIDWKLDRDGLRPEVTIVVHSPGRDVQRVAAPLGVATQGTESLEVGFGAGSMADLPADAEFYFVVRDPQAGDVAYKVSNSVTLGSAGVTYARNWTQAEADRIAAVSPLRTMPGAQSVPAGGSPTTASQPAGRPVAQNNPTQGGPPQQPPNQPGFPPGRPGQPFPPGFPPNGPFPQNAPGSKQDPAVLAIGEDSEFLGNVTGGEPRKLVDAGKPAVGLNFALGDWAGGPCLSRLTPVFGTGSSPADQKQLTKPGWLIGALNVNADKVVRGVQPVWYKARADGTLDTSEAAPGEWAGVSSDSPKRLGGDGRAVIGLFVRQGLIVDAVAVVLEKRK